MAVGIHVVYIGRKPIQPDGTVLNKNTATIQQMQNASGEDRVLADSAIENSAGYPTIKAYLEAEAADNYVLHHISQTMIVTYNVANINDA